MSTSKARRPLHAVHVARGCDAGAGRAVYDPRAARALFNEEDYLRLRDSYILTPDKLETAKPDMSILHPLPRVNEIAAAVDNDPRACYFKQVKNGRYIRMALMLKLLGID